MIAILRAPELSATSRIDRIWIMTASPGAGRSSFLPVPPLLPFPPSSHFRRLPHDPRERPALAPAERPRLHNRDGIARLRLVLLVVHHERRRAALRLAVQPVAHLPLDGDDDALLHLVADDDAHF